MRERGAYCGYLDTCIQARGFLYDPFDRVFQIACDVVELLCGECGSAAGSREAAFAGRVYDVREVAGSVRIPLSILPIERSRSHGIVAQHFAGVSDNGNVLIEGYDLVVYSHGHIAPVGNRTADIAGIGRFNRNSLLRHAVARYVVGLCQSRREGEVARGDTIRGNCSRTRYVGGNLVAVLHEFRQNVPVVLLGSVGYRDQRTVEVFEHDYIFAHHLEGGLVVVELRIFYRVVLQGAQRLVAFAFGFGDDELVGEVFAVGYDCVVFRNELDTLHTFAGAGLYDFQGDGEHFFLFELLLVVVRVDQHAELAFGRAYQLYLFDVGVLGARIGRVYLFLAEIKRYRTVGITRDDAAGEFSRGNLEGDPLFGVGVHVDRLAVVGQDIIVAQLDHVLRHLVP